MRAMKIAKQCKSFVVKDQDGKYILDVIGKTAKASVTTINTELVREGYHHILKYQIECRQKGDKN